MPELPEVETTARYLNKNITGLKIIDIWTDWKKFIKEPKNFNDFLKLIKNKKVSKVWRKGKNVLINLEGNLILAIHQKMSGHLLYGKWKRAKNIWQPISPKTLNDPYNRFIHLIFFFDNKKMMGFCDVRKFGRILFGLKEEILNMPELKNLAPDALQIKFEDFKNRLNRTRGKIKALLLNQEKIVSGIGNIYSDEILWLSKINPLKDLSSLNDKEIKDLYRFIRQILTEGIKHQGYSMRDYRTPDGAKGNYQNIRKIYERENKTCFRCKSIIKSVKIASRTTRFCPKCQK